MVGKRAHLHVGASREAIDWRRYEFHVIGDRRLRTVNGETDAFTPNHHCTLLGHLVYNGRFTGDRVMLLRLVDAIIVVGWRTVDDITLDPLLRRNLLGGLVEKGHRYEAGRGMMVRLLFQQVEVFRFATRIGMYAAGRFAVGARAVGRRTAGDFRVRVGGHFFRWHAGVAALEAF